MASRFYFPASTSADVSPSFHSSWSNTASAIRRKLGGTKGASTITPTSSIAGTNYTLIAQFVSDALDAQTILSTVTGSGQILVSEVAAGSNVDIIITACRLFSNDGSTLRATLFEWNFYGTYNNEFPVNPSFRNGILMTSGLYDIGTYGSAGSNIAVTAGDRRVFEIGFGLVGAGTGGAYAVLGEDAADLPTDDETQTTDGAGWFELSQTLVFQGGGDVLDPMGAAGFFGA